MAAPIDPVIESSRLRLTRLMDSDVGSLHLKWFHEHWSDPENTKWSLSGPTASFQDSQARMRSFQADLDLFNYQIHVKPAAKTELPLTPNIHLEDHGYIRAGMVGLRHTAKGRTDVTVLSALPSHPDPEQEGKKLNVRPIGYSIYAPQQGQGYATEAATALLAAYSKYRSQEAFKEEKSWVEGVVDRDDNPASKRVLEKIGLTFVGEMEDVEPVFIAGKWRSTASVYGKWI